MKRSRDEVARFAIGPVQSYGGAFPQFKQPKELACYSRGASRAVSFDRSALRAYRAPALPAALDVGFEQYIPKSADADEPAPLRDVLGALEHGGVDVSSHHIVTYRNNLNKLMLTPYSPRDDWEIGVERHGGSLHLLVRDTERKVAEEANRDERQQRMCYWGYRFEQLSTGDGPAAGGQASGSRRGELRVPSPSDLSTCEGLYGEAEMARLRAAYAQPQPAGGAAQGAAAGSDAAVNANEEFCVVMGLGIEGLRLVMAAEVDCADKSGGREAYVELKTSKLIHSARDEANFGKHKLLKFWLQSFLAGVPKIVVGFRDDAGVVRELRPLETMKIPRMVRGKDDMWDPCVCLNFGKQVLEWLVQQMRQLPPDARAVLRYEPSVGALLLHRQEAS